MLTDQLFNAWCDNNKIPEHTKSLIQSIRSSDPARRVQSSANNVSGKYPSRKMGVTIQYESHTLELALINELEYDSNVYEYYCQPNKIKIDYMGLENGNTKRKHFLYTPDFFLIRRNKAGWVECKTEEQLLKLSLKDPNRYYKDEQGNWRCPPGEDYARKYNLSFSVFSSSQINKVCQRNLNFLKYYYDHPVEVLPIIEKKIYKFVDESPGILLEDLLKKASDLQIKPDNIYSLISSGHIFVDLNQNVLAQPKYTYVYTDAVKAQAYIHLESNTKAEWGYDTPPFIELTIGSSINWDGKLWEIINSGETTVSLRADHRILDLTYAQFNSFIKKGKISGVKQSSEHPPLILDAFQKASKEQLEIATQRYKVIKPYLENEKSSPNRTIRDWISKYRSGEKVHGYGYIGLLPQVHKRGNRTKKLNEETYELMEQWIKTNYETYKQKGKKIVYGQFLKDCELKGVPCCSYKTFSKYICSRPTHEQIKMRQGDKAAYPHEAYYLEYESTVRHGDRPFEIAHIDHTQLDIELIDQNTKRPLGRPWVTFMVDAFTRRILAIYLTFDPPSYRSCMMVIRECVSKWSRLPENIVVDGGKEFSSIYFEQLLAVYQCNKKQRPASKPRYGSVLERLFGTTNTQFIYTLQGNTQITKNVRQTTKKNNPKKLAVWTFETFVERLSQFVYEVYDQLGHPVHLGESPKEIFQATNIKYGERGARLIPYDETFKILTLPSSRKGKAKIEPNRGFKLNYIYYWSEEFRDPNIEGTSVPIRYDPFNIGIAYAYVKNVWVKCMSDYPFFLNNKTEKQMKILSEEIKKKHQNHSKNFKINLRILADFAQQCESQELELQRMKDDALKNSSSIDVNKIPQSNPLETFGPDEAKEEMKFLDKKTAYVDASFAGESVYSDVVYGEF